MSISRILGVSSCAHPIISIIDVTAFGAEPTVARGTVTVIQKLNGESSSITPHGPPSISSGSLSGDLSSVGACIYSRPEIYIATQGNKGVNPTLGSSLFGVQLLPLEPIGTVNINLTNVVIGSIYRVEIESTGETVASDVITSPTFSIPVPLYKSGSLRNILRLKIRKGTSSPFYRPYETIVSITPTGASVYISQISDE